MADTTALANLETSQVPDTKIAEALKEIDLSSPTITMSYGTKTMTDIAAFADTILSNVRAKDAGAVGTDLQNLMLKVKGIKIEDIANSKKSFWASLPIIGSLFDTVSNKLAEYDSAAKQIDAISDKLDEAQLGLLKDIEVLEQLYDNNKNFYTDLTAHIIAGEQRLEQARTVDLPALEKKAQESKDNMDAQAVRDFAEVINRFEKRLHDLKLSRTITLQTAPQIRMIQANNRTLAEKIQTSILATIPIWKSQLVLALSIHGQKNAAELQKSVADTTNEMLKKNAEMLQTSTVETAREVERSIVDVETLRDVQGKLISTIEETLNIANEGRTKRREAEKELAAMENDLRVRLTELAAKSRADTIAAARGTTETAAAS
ncbi:MAG: toxic anion resistance protein [Duodenibacillus sp.]|nr:toxic anion resistance protein [Duodenibacillus sp.]HBC70266.1 toxic anion resistance protein [Sutterella sp.]